jgi:signal transduction histidine kinase
MDRRYGEVVRRSFVFGGLAIAGLYDLAIAFFSFCLLCVGLVFFLPPAVEYGRRRTERVRRLTGLWCEVDIPSPYRPAPPEPERERDGWFRVGNSLYKRARWIRWEARLEWAMQDPATIRELWWQLLTPLVAVPLPIATLFAGPAALRGYGRWTRWWLRERPKAEKRWLNRNFEALGYQLELFGLSLAHLVVSLLQVLVCFAPSAVTLSRTLGTTFRRQAEVHAGVRIERPYLPPPPFPTPRPDGKYRLGNRLYDQPWWPARMDRLRWILRDRATWRDLGAAVVNPVALLVLALPPVAVTFFGFLGLQALWLWRPIAYWSHTSWSTTHWFAMIGLPEATTNLQALALTPVSLAFFLVGPALSPRLLKREAQFGRLLLGPTDATRLAQRVERVERTRTAATDAQAEELRRIERDLHDGVQARLVAMGMKLAAVEVLIDNDPAEAKRLVKSLRESSSTTLTELRDLVRGIHPPVLSERGLGDAVRAVALDSPLKVAIEFTALGRVERPAEACAYFVVCELLGNAVKHGGAKRGSVDLRHDGSTLWIVVTDDGRGGANPARGSGLRGIERRIGAFDGRLTLESPVGGPTKATVELPCQPDPEPSSPKTSTSFETA